MENTLRSGISAGKQKGKYVFYSLFFSWNLHTPAINSFNSMWLLFCLFSEKLGPDFCHSIYRDTAPPPSR